VKLSHNWKKQQQQRRTRSFVLVRKHSLHAKARTIACFLPIVMSTMKLERFLIKNALKWVIIVSSLFVVGTNGNPDAKRLYDDLLSNYNRLIRPVSNNTDTVLVKLGLRLSQLIDLVSQFHSIRMHSIKA